MINAAKENKRPTPGQALLRAVILEADHAADIFVDELERRKGFPQENSRKRAPTVGPRLTEALRMAAHLRREEWRRQGLDRYLSAYPTGTSGSEDAQVRNSFDSEKPDTSRSDYLFARTTFLLWLRHFSGCGREELGVDVVLGGGDAISDEQLHEVADFLWTHRPCGQKSEGGERAST